MFKRKCHLFKITVAFVIACYGNIAYAQNSTLHPKTVQFANEVYQECSEYLNSELLSLYDEQVRRVVVLEFTAEQLYDIKLLTSFGLKNKCNPSLIYDGANFNPENFNPLKYFLNYSASEPQYVRVNNTNYVIEILPKQ